MLRIIYPNDDNWISAVPRLTLDRQGCPLSEANNIAKGSS